MSNKFWILFLIIAVTMVGFGIMARIIWCEKKHISAIAFIGVLISILLSYIGIRAYQAIVFSNGLERVITIYSMDGSIIAQYHGNINIESERNGTIVFDFEGNRYTYYNCFVESVGKIPHIK